MNRFSTHVFLCFVTTSFVVLLGCDSSGPGEVTAPTPNTNGKSHDHGDSHQGPHDGHVIDLGRSHQYHAELVENHDEKSLTIYILGEDLEETAIDQESISLASADG